MRRRREKEPAKKKKKKKKKQKQKKHETVSTFPLFLFKCCFITSVREEDGILILSTLFASFRYLTRV